MSKSLLRFLIVFLLCMLVTYGLHNFFINRYSLYSDETILRISYFFTTMYTILLTSCIILFSTKLKDQLGFIFLAGSFLKIAIFLGYTKLSDLGIDKSVFFDFFIPYFVSLFLEVYFISKTLNSIK